MTDDVIRLREEIDRPDQRAQGHEEDGRPCTVTTSPAGKERQGGCQWLYFGYLAAIKTQNGAAMSVGRISTFLDIYIERDLEAAPSRERGTGADRPSWS